MLRLLSILKAWEPRARQAVNNYQHMRRLIDEISVPEWQRLEAGTAAYIELRAGWGG